MSLRRNTRQAWVLNACIISMALSFLPLRAIAETSNPTCEGTPATILGTSADDTLIGTRADDVLVAGGGADVVKGLGGNDVICGGRGPDSVVGGNGQDLVVGEAGNDELVGGSGEDVLRGSSGGDAIGGGAGNDVLVGGIGDDVMIGGVGVDTVSYAGTSIGVVADLASGSATGVGGDSVTSAEGLVGGSGSDVLTGDESDNGLMGGAGDDTLQGGTGDDSLLGENGEDALAGEAGMDSLDGGPNADVLDPGEAANGASEHCVIGTQDTFGSGCLFNPSLDYLGPSQARVVHPSWGDMPGFDSVTMSSCLHVYDALTDEEMGSQCWPGGGGNSGTKLTVNGLTPEHGYIAKLEIYDIYGQHVFSTGTAFSTIAVPPLG